MIKYIDKIYLAVFYSHIYQVKFTKYSSKKKILDITYINIYQTKIQEAYRFENFRPL